MSRLKAHLVTILGALMMISGLFFLATEPVSASSCGVQLYDGSGHTFTFYATCNQSFAIGDLTRYSATCIGNFGINQGTENDCVNQVRFFGSWGTAFALFTFQDTYEGGRSDGVDYYKCSHTSIDQLNIVDEMSSFLVTTTSQNCT